MNECTKVRSTVPCVANGKYLIPGEDGFQNKDRSEVVPVCGSEEC